MSPFFQSLGKIIAVGLFSISSFLTGVASHFVPMNLGSAQPFNPVQAAPSFLSGAGVTANATSVNLTAFATRQGTLITTANIGGIGFATIDPGTSKEENISFTGITQNVNGSAVLTGVTRGLSPLYPYTASTTLQVAHSGGSTLILSNSAPFYAQFNIAANTSTITGQWTFSSSSIPKTASDTTIAQISGDLHNLVDYQTLASTSFAGVVNGSTSTKGIYQSATNADIASGTLVGSTGAGLTLTTSVVTTTSTPNSIPATNASGTLPASFISTNTTYSVGGIISASSTFNGTTTFPLSTSSILSTNSSGSVVGLGSASTGSIVSYNNGRWQTGMVRNFSTSSVLVNTTSLMQVATLTLPIASPSSVYEFSIYYNNGIGGSGVANTTTIKLVGGSSSSTIWSCAAAGTVSGGTFWGKIFMQGSTSSEHVLFLQPSFDNVNCSSTSFVTDGLFSLDLSSNPFFAITTQINSTTKTAVVTSTIWMMQ